MSSDKRRVLQALADAGIEFRRGAESLERQSIFVRKLAGVSPEWLRKLALEMDAARAIVEARLNA